MINDRHELVWAMLAAGWTLAVGSPTLAAQEPATVDETYFAIEGCYEVRPEGGAAWLRGLENRIYLSTSELVPSSPREAPEFVVRAAPGQRASWFPAVTWLLGAGGGPLQVTWWGPMEMVVATFPVEDLQEPRRLDGSVRYLTDILGYPPPRVPVTLLRVDCGSGS